MKSILMCLALYTGQINTMVERPIVHLQPNRAAIEVGFGGATLQLLNAPAIVHLPPVPPERDPAGDPWVIRITNFGPKMVTIVDKGRGRIPVGVGGAVTVYSDGAAYSWRP